MASKKATKKPKSVTLKRAKAARAGKYFFPADEPVEVLFEEAASIAGIDPDSKDWRKDFEANLKGQGYSIVKEG